MSRPFLLDFAAGIQRDGTAFDANRCLDAQWCRWRLARPRKMGGYKLITDNLNGIPRKAHCFYQNGLIYTHVGTTNGIMQVVSDARGNLVSTADRTPATFTADAEVGFTFDVIFDTTSGVVQLVASAVPDTQALSSSIKTVPFLGQVDSPSGLLQFSNPGSVDGGTWVQPKVSGGVVCIQPYVFDFDSDGLVQWSAPNLPLFLGVTQGSSGAGQARISAQKIVAGMPLRGGGIQVPAGIFWSLSEVIIAVFVGGSAFFAFNTISPSSSILSSDSVVEYDGLYFWPGVDRFLMFNGTVAEVPNPQNQDWFFSNITPGYEARTFGFKVPQYGEIWWCAPMFGATEPSHACIFNLRENTFYDTVLPDGGRGAGFWAQGGRYPVMADLVNGGNGYGLWLHEFGVDKVAGTTVSAVRSYFETPWIGGPKNSQPDDHGLSFQQFEADLDQTGDLTVTLIGAANPRAPVVIGPSVLIPDVPAVPQEQLSSFTATTPQRLTRFHIESNTPGGNYIMGRNIAHGDQADARITS